jgi:hypothetical protein
MARQYLVEGPYIDPPITSPLSADTATGAVAMWTGLQYTPIFANEAKAGRIYVVHAGGLITTAATGALTITPTYGVGGVALGASIAQTVPASSLSGPWQLEFELVFRTIGAPGSATSTAVGCGTFRSGGVAATANSGLTVAFGGTSATVDTSANSSISITKTLSVAGSFTTLYAYGYWRN